VALNLKKEKTKEKLKMGLSRIMSELVKQTGQDFQQAKGKTKSVSY